MEQKKGFALRISKDTLEAIEKWANDEFRSINGQIEWILQDSLIRYKRKNNEKDKNNLNNSK